MSFVKGVRPASHAGSWYEDDAETLSAELDGYLSSVPKTLDNDTLPVNNARFIIAPFVFLFLALLSLCTPADNVFPRHAGYSYSGPCAAWAYKCLDLRNAKRVFVLGPSHTYYLAGCALSTATAYATPFGSLRVDTATVSELQPLLAGTMPPRNEIQEHSLEMHMPYLYKQLQAVHGAAAADAFPAIVPILVGDMDTDEEKRVGGILAPYLRDPHTAVIVSSDFCHWGAHFRYRVYAHDGTLASLKPLRAQPGAGEPRIHETIRMLDQAAMDAIETGSVDAFKKVLEDTDNTICGRHPIAVAMAALEEMGSKRPFKFVRYERSALVTKLADSSVSYASAYAVLE
ncbi:hypothetical protein TD95_000285 [Thielaviopsis punctulata]|uniref:AmmeMemoRadiSam system protein B n=1 Tax=Thielaviopsis punctulata TaxID=72032 RepID=A0A0F4ZG09_9PEZI|nr:hypothetical protein TD95_000285 [Thielaviopsis punctulata]